MTELDEELGRGVPLHRHVYHRFESHKQQEYLSGLPFFAHSLFATFGAFCD